MALDYKKTYEDTARELAEVIALQESLERKKIRLRRTLEALAGICREDGIIVSPSVEAAGIINVSGLADDIRSILVSIHPSWITPHRFKTELPRIGRDLIRYKNAQSAIHMVLKRMIEAGDVREETMGDGKKAYRYVPLTERFNVNLGLGGIDYDIQPAKEGLYRSFPKR